jgi:hypothetical protein
MWHKDRQNMKPPSANKPRREKRSSKLISVIIAVLITTGLFGCASSQEKKSAGRPADAGKKSTKTIQPDNDQLPSMPLFAKYKEQPVTIKPIVKPYKINSDLSNVINKKDFELSAAAQKMLAKNGFVVQGYGKDDYPAREFFHIYEGNRYSLTPNFITSDSILHSYHLMFDYLLKNLETSELSQELEALTGEMLAASLEQYKEAQGTGWENAAKTNVAYFAVAAKLLDRDATVPATVKDEVKKEMVLIDAHQGFSPSPVLNMAQNTGQNEGSGVDDETQLLREDYSQYVPRGHYEKSSQLQAYFKAMMWYGRMTFRFEDANETKSAVLMTVALNNEKKHKSGKGTRNLNSWQAIYEPTSFFVGVSDDITYYQLNGIISKVYGKNAGLETLTKDEKKFASLREMADKQLDAPKINSMPVFRNEDRTEQIKGFRFMGQRFTVDAAIFQRLVDREVPRRMLPNGLDIPSAMGSDEALSILESAGETDYENYSKNMEKLRTYIGKLKVDDWTQNLYWSWLYTLKPLTDEKPEGYPSFMRNRAWVRKDLNTYLGSWTELKHDTILYAKQVYAEMGGDDFEKKDDRGYVEPNPYLYGRLAALIEMTRDGLADRKLLNDERSKKALDIMKELSLSLKTISEKELSNKTLTDDEYELIRSYGGQIEHLWKEARDEGDLGGTPTIEDDSPALIADVATGMNAALEEGTGYVNKIYAVVPLDGKLHIACGGVYSHYEFEQPISDRLTDSKWGAMLKAGTNPDMPEWVEEFMSKK